MRLNSTLIAAIATVLSQKFAEERATPTSKKDAPRPICMGMDCTCGGQCPADKPAIQAGAPDGETK